MLLRGSCWKRSAVLLEVPVAEELVDHTPAAVLAQLRCVLAVPQQRLDGGAERLEVGRIAHEQSVGAVLDLIDDAADRTGDDGLSLPHRLRDRQAEALGEALLDDDRRVALDRVHDRRVLVGIGHGDAGEVDAAARGVRQLPPEARCTRRAPRRPRGRRRRR